MLGNGQTPGRAEIEAARPPRAPVDPRVPYAYLVEPERSSAGPVEQVATIFLTNSECPFRCLFCDLWKNTTTESVPVGAIPGQIDFALSRLPAARHVKLYNSGNFFDARAIPPEDHALIAARVARFETVIVENHPRLCGGACVAFRELLHAAADRLGAAQPPVLEIAMGLETVHPGILPRLSKQMTAEDFQSACRFLTSEGISVRAFVLLKPPYLKAGECVEWALRSVEFAFDCGARVCSVIPTRGGNGILERLAESGDFSPPTLGALEQTLEKAILTARGRVFADLWDARKFAQCPLCAEARVARLRAMNDSQEVIQPIECSCGSGAADHAPGPCPSTAGQSHASADATAGRFST